MRNTHGVSITELLVTAILVAFAFATIGELAILTTLSSYQLTNCISGVNGANLFIRRVSDDVRASEIIGNAYALKFPNNLPDVTSANDITPYVIANAGGAPSSPWPAVPYVLSPQCLIIQQPASFHDPSQITITNNTITSTNVMEGAPLMIPAGSISNGSPPVPRVNVQFLDTVIYVVVPDPQAPPQYMIQRIRFSGFPTGAQWPPPLSPNAELSNWISQGAAALRAPIEAPQTVLRGVVGPFDLANPSNPPAVFQYLTTPGTPSYTSPYSLSYPAGGDIPYLCGVGVNVEVETPVPPNGTKTHHAGCHAECYLKSNTNIRMSNT